MSRSSHRRETREQREHRYDREVIAAVYRCERAKAGEGYKFLAPKRKAA